MNVKNISPIADTPLMRQYAQIKTKHPDAILLFRVGDFYETFSTDAIKASAILGITLTKRANGSASFVELAGFPFHALDTYLPKLVRAGQRVAICEQLEDPKLTKKIVKRGITEMVTPGVVMNENILQNRESNYLACIHLVPKHENIQGIALMDFSTGEFLVSQGNLQYIEKVISAFNPKEILFERSQKQYFESQLGSKIYSYPLEDWMFSEQTCYERLLKQFDAASLKGFGIQNYAQGIIAAGAILNYMDLIHQEKIGHITSIARIEDDDFVWIDKFSFRNLEIFQSNHENSKCFIDVIDRSSSPMGARMLRRWVAFPSKNLELVNSRLEMVDFLFKSEEIRENCIELLKQMGDMERMASKIALSKIAPRECVALKHMLSILDPIKKLFENSECNDLKKLVSSLDLCIDLREKIAREILENAPAQLSKGNVIAPGVSDELDEIKNLLATSKEYLEKLEQKMSLETGISSLRIDFNAVFGYYFEVRNMHKHKVPKEWTRKQTLANAERYINQELKEYETKIFGAQDRISQIESKIFEELLSFMQDYIARIQANSFIIGQLDCLLSFAKVSLENDYCKPLVSNQNLIDIKQGRHPVIEKLLPEGESYIANDVFLDQKTQQIIIITGPNMSGKSALLRQTALIVLMAQTGCFVPAQEAHIGLVDKIFTRVGASDNIAQGESTFMVEMSEAASILNNVSDRSLILFDELGRGTSTYDGISIAWAIIEHIHENPKAKAKTLFATHYHELNDLENDFHRIKNYNVSVKEVNNKVIFIRKLVQGGSEHSFGIHVARMAGMPKSIVSRSEEILKQLESIHEEHPSSKPQGMGHHREGYQLSIFQLDDPVLKQIRDEIKKVDINSLTPIEALNKLSEIKKMIGL